MVHIHYSRDGNEHHLQITGHAGYAPAGQDIVCAGISALSCALLEHLRQTGTAAEAACRRGALRLRCGAGGRADSAFQMALAGYRIIAKTYPQHVAVDISPYEKGGEKETTEYAQEQHNRDGL